MPRRETVTQRAYRRRRESASRNHRRGLTGSVDIFRHVESTQPQQHRRELGCWVQGLLIVAPVVADMFLWYVAVNAKDPDILGVAFVGAPIAFMMSFTMANIRYW